jgi:hypothetical protein
MGMSTPNRGRLEAGLKAGLEVFLLLTFCPHILLCSQGLFMLLSAFTLLCSSLSFFFSAITFYTPAH